MAEFPRLANAQSFHEVGGLDTDSVRPLSQSLVCLFSFLNALPRTTTLLREQTDEWLVLTTFPFCFSQLILPANNDHDTVDSESRSCCRRMLAR